MEDSKAPVYEPPALEEFDTGGYPILTVAGASQN